MPRSRTRHKHQHGHPVSTSAQPVKPKPKRKAAYILAVVVSVMGVVITLFINGAELQWLITGAVIGLIAGYVMGQSIDRTIAKRQP